MKLCKNLIRFPYEWSPNTWKILYESYRILRSTLRQSHTNHININYESYLKITINVKGTLGNPVRNLHESDTNPIRIIYEIYWKPKGTLSKSYTKSVRISYDSYNNSMKKLYESVRGLHEIRYEYHTKPIRIQYEYTAKIIGILMRLGK